MSTPSDLNGALGPSLKDQLRALNCDFLELLIFEHGQMPCAERLRNLFLPTAVAKELIGLPPAALGAVARCQYTLFSLAFHATETWRRVAQTCHGREPVDRRYRIYAGIPAANRSACMGFCSAALMFAWHLHHLDQRLARVILGLRHETAEAFASIPLWRIQQLPHERLDLLTARWPDNPGFWPDLIKFARAGSPAQLESARLVGAQLIAQELEPSSIQRLSPPTSPRRR